jgi:hypothetical protein
MSPRALIPALLAMAGVLASAPGANAAASRPCAMKGSKTIAASEHSRVFRTRPDADGETDVVGCLYSAGRRHRLGNGGTGILDETWVGQVRLAGGFVAFSDGIGGRYGAGFSVVVVDLRTGKRRIAYSVPPRPDSGQTAHVESIVLRGNGSAAWMYVFGASPEDTPERFVARLDRDGEATLAQGVDIQSGSLALARRTVYWTQAGEPRFGQLN